MQQKKCIAKVSESVGTDLKRDGGQEVWIRSRTRTALEQEPFWTRKHSGREENEDRCVTLNVMCCVNRISSQAKETKPGIVDDVIHPASHPCTLLHSYHIWHVSGYNTDILRLHSHLSSPSFSSHYIIISPLTVTCGSLPNRRSQSYLSVTRVTLD